MTALTFLAFFVGMLFGALLTVLAVALGRISARSDRDLFDSHY